MTLSLEDHPGLWGNESISLASGFVWEVTETVLVLEGTQWPAVRWPLEL